MTFYFILSKPDRIAVLAFWRFPSRWLLAVILLRRHHLEYFLGPSARGLSSINLALLTVASYDSSLMWDKNRGNSYPLHHFPTFLPHCVCVSLCVWSRYLPTMTMVGHVDIPGQSAGGVPAALIPTHLSTNEASKVAADVPIMGPLLPVWLWLPKPGCYDHLGDDQAR